MTATAIAVTCLVLLAPVAAVAGPRALLRVPATAVVAAYAVVLPWGSAVKLPVGPDPFDTVSTVVGLIATFVVLVQLVLQARSVRSVPGPVVPWLALSGWLLLTVVWSVDPAASVKALAVLGSLVGLYVLVSLLPFSRRELCWLELGAVGGGLVVAAQALLTTARGGLGETSSRLPRFTYDDGDPNIIAATLLLPLALAVWWALHAATGVRRLAGLVAAVALLSSIVVTGSRGGIVAAVVVLVAVVAASPGLPLARAAAYAAAVVSAFAVTLLVIPEGLLRHLSDTDSTGRTDIWRIGLQACASTCDTGTGYGTFGAVYREVYLSELGLPGFGDRAYAAHNAFLSMLVEGGVVGLSLMVLAFVVLVRGLLRTEARRRGPALAALAGLVASNALLSNLGFKYFWMTLLYATLVVATASRPAPGSTATGPSATASSGTAPPAGPAAP